MKRVSDAGYSGENVRHIVGVFYHLQRRESVQLSHHKDKEGSRNKIGVIFVNHVRSFSGNIPISSSWFQNMQTPGTQNVP